VHQIPDLNPFIGVEVVADDAGAHSEKKGSDTVQAEQRLTESVKSCKS
jgi:hypothetical protein